MQKRRIGASVLLGVAIGVVAACDGGESSSGGPEPAATGPTEPGAAAENEPGAASDPGGGEVGGTVVEWTEAGFRTVFDFVANRHLIHTYDTGLFVDFGAPSAYKYVQGRWRGPWLPGRDEGGRTIGYTDGIGATFRVPLTEVTGNLELVARMRGVGGDQRMDVFVNSDDALPTVTGLPRDLDLVRVTLPAARLHVGENTIRFHFARSVEESGVGRTAGAFDWVRLQAPGEDPDPSHLEGSFGTLTDSDGVALRASTYGQLATYLTVPESARLRLHVVTHATPGPVPARVSLRLDGADPVALWSGEVGAEPVPVEVDLNAYAGEVVRLELIGGAPVGPGWLRWVAPRLVVPEQPRRTASGPLPQRVLVWLVDTLRADFFTPYNADAPADTPNMTAFAERCVRFARHTVQGNSSLPASGSIHTATYPVVHHINDAETRIDRDLTVLGQAVDAAGFDTALFSSNGYITESRGFGRGYDTYRNLIHEPGRPDSENLWPIANAWLAARPEDSRWLVFLNTIDPHVPYDPPDDILRRYYPNDYTGSIRPRATGELLDSLGDRGMSDSDLRYLRALHYGEITYNDVWFGHMLESLEALGVLDQTLIVITSDHGEGFMEHGRLGHGTSVNEEVVSVPLLFCTPALGTGVIETEVESVDLYPTLLDMLDLEVPPSVQGISLLPLIDDPTPVMNRPAFSYHQEFLRGLRIGRWKYQLRTGDNDDLYDLREAPLEGENRRGQAPIAYRYMRDVMAFHLAFDESWHKEAWGFANNHSEAFAMLLDERPW